MYHVIWLLLVRMCVCVCVCVLWVRRADSIFVSSRKEHHDHLSSNTKMTRENIFSVLLPCLFCELTPLSSYRQADAAVVLRITSGWYISANIFGTPNQCLLANRLETHFDIIFRAGWLLKEENFRISYQRYVACRLALWILRVLWQERWYIETCL